MFAKRYISENEYQVVEYYDGGSRILPIDQHDYLAWCKENTPKIEAGDRFLSVVDEKIVVAPDKEAILAAEAAAQAAEEARIAQKQQDIIDNLPSWQQISDAIDAATTIAATKAILKKIARVVYWMAKDKAE